MATSARKSEVSSVREVTVSDPSTVVLQLDAPFAPLVAQLADRAGMVMSPTALQKSGGADFGAGPVCVGPFKFDNRVAQDHIDVVKDQQLLRRQHVHLDKITYKIIADCDHPVQQPALRRRAGARRGRADRRRRAAGRRQPGAADLGDPRLPGITVNIGNINGVGKPAGTLPANLASAMSTDPGCGRRSS